MNLKPIAFVVACIILAACTPTEENRATQNSFWARQTATVWTLTPTINPTATAIPTPTKSPTPTITPTPVLPVGMGTQLPQALHLQTINPENVSQLQLIRSIPVGLYRVVSLLFSPDGSSLAADYNVRGYPEKQFILANVNAGTYSLYPGVHPAFSPKGDYVVTNGKISRFQNGQVTDEIKSLEGIGYPYSFSPDASVLITNISDTWSSSIRVYDTTNWSELRSFVSRRGSKLISPNAETYVIYDNSGNLAIRSLLDDSLVTYGNYDVRSIGYSSDGNYLGINVFDGMIFVFDLTDIKIPRSTEIHNEGRCFQEGGLSFSPDNQLLALACEENGIQIVKIWSFPDADLLASIPVGKGAMSLSFSPHGRMLAIGVSKSFYPDPEENEIWLMGIP